MRKLPVLAIGVLSLQAVLAPAASATTVTPTPTPTAQQHSYDGTFKSSAATGPAGTVIKLESITPCGKISGKPAAHVTALLLSQAQVEKGSGFTAGANVVPDPQDGDWSATITVPADAKVAEYALTAVCFDAKYNPDTACVFEPQSFLVTAATPPTTAPAATPTVSVSPSPTTPPTPAPAVPATAVPGTPSFTG